MELFKISWKNWVLLNGMIFFGFFLMLLFEGRLVWSGIRVFFGLAVFFLIGMNLSLVENIVLRVKDWFFIITLGLFNSFFIIPVFILISSLFFQSISEVKVIFSSVILIVVLLSIQYKYRHEAIV